MREVLKKFGRYFLLDQIAQGGMAEIYRARLATVDGAGRLIVIKRIQAGHGSNVEFLQMFRSEIKVTMGFNHPNIVQLYDFGDEQGQPFIAMELVDGKNLKQFINRSFEKTSGFPIELAAYIIEQSAAGLQYAHVFKDKISGVPLNIVHRDISPQNILISFEGNVKVIDFGIAKATVNSEATRAGVIKGKPSYLSPEQINGDVLDGRSDLFSLGAVFWELLTGKKLFAGDNDLAVLKMIESCETSVKPPSSLNPNVPKELDAIVLKCLARQREKRYQTTEELQRALRKFLVAHSVEFDPGELSYYLKDLFKEDIVEDRKRIQKLNEKVESLLSADLSSEIISEPIAGVEPLTVEESTTVVRSDRSFSGLHGVASPREAVTSVPLSKAPGTKVEIERVPPLSRSVSAKNSHPRPEPRPVPRQKLKKRKNAGVLMKFFALAAASVAAVAMFGDSLGVHVPYVSDFFKESALSKGPAVSRDNQTDTIVPVNGLDTELPVQPLLFPPNPAGKKMVNLRLNVTPMGGAPRIVLNGREIDSGNPIAPVPMDSALELLVERRGFKPFKREFVVDSQQVGGQKEWPMEIALDPLSYGYLTIHTTPSSEATIMIDGRPWVKRTPLEEEKFPVGTYTIRLDNEILGMGKTVTVSVREGKKVFVDEKLQARGPAGK